MTASYTSSSSHRRSEGLCHQPPNRARLSTRASDSKPLSAPASKDLVKKESSALTPFSAPDESPIVWKK
ncbi:uncharacterized protein B0I36DRAFT_337198, partial [Microdochium trichocladiopsis]